MTRRDSPRSRRRFANLIRPLLLPYLLPYSELPFRHQRSRHHNSAKRLPRSSFGHRLHPSLLLSRCSSSSQRQLRQREPRQSCSYFFISSDLLSNRPASLTRRVSFPQIILGGLFPRIAKVNKPKAKFEQMQQGSLLKDHEAKEVKLFDQSERVFLHPVSPDPLLLLLFSTSF